jgi:hypothetical protein
MHFIERLFDVSPDGGNGALELIWLALPLAIMLMTAAARRRCDRTSDSK